MRKITLLAGAALMASSALAAGPTMQAHIASKAVKMQKIEQMSKAAAFSSRADEGGEGETPVANGAPNYYTPNSFYLGMSNEWYAGKYTTVMFNPQRGLTTFVPLGEYTNSTWAWNELVRDDQNQWQPVPQSFEADTLRYEGFPYLQLDGGMTLTATPAGGEANTYTNEHVTAMLFGRNATEWGWDEEGQGLYGLTPVPCGLATAGKSWYIWGGYYGFDKTDTENNNENGAFNGAVENFENCSNVKLEMFASTIPSPNAWYQLKNVYFMCRSVNSEDMAINVNVYEIDEEGHVIDRIVAKGSAVISANTAAEPFYDFLTVNISGVNVLGYTTNRPLSTNKGLYFEISGMTAESCESFYMMVNGSERVSLEEWSAQTYWRKVFPGHAQVIYSMTDNATEETIMDVDPYVHAYYADDTKTTLAITNDFMIYYDIDFPQVFDAYTGSADFEGTLPEDGGSVEFDVDGSYDFAQLYNDGFMDAQATEEWISFDVTYDETEKYTVVNVWANSDCPEGVDGRTGKINFTGEACDFTISVTQPAGAKGSIDDIKVVKGAAEYYDLQGRRLQGAPAKGVYIQRNGATATKLMR